MRIIYCLIVVLFSHFSSAQNSKEIIELINLYHNPVEFQTDSTGFSLLPDIPKGFNENYEFLIEKLHVEDLDGDGKMDLINPYTWPPITEVSIYLNQGGSLEKVYSYPGKLVQIIQSESGSDIIIIKKACCCDYSNEIIKVSIQEDQSIIEQKVIFHNNTNLITKPKLVTESRKGILRTCPILNDTIYEDPCSGEKVIGNQLMTIPKQKIGILKKEGKWAQVIYQSKEGYYWIGWLNE